MGLGFCQMLKHARIVGGAVLRIMERQIEKLPLPGARRALKFCLILLTGRYRTGDTCQIGGLGRTYYRVLGPRLNGTFVEVGAFDGETFSNTSFLADLGWCGIYIEPIEEYAERCRKRHAHNPNVSVVNCAVGNGHSVRLHKAGPMSTSSAVHAKAYAMIDWAAEHLTNETVDVPQRRLDSILSESGIQPGFDILVVDTEGSERDVFGSFDLRSWGPRMLIVEIGDNNSDLAPYPKIVRRAKALRNYLTGHGYRELHRDEINTIFVRRADGAIR